MKGMVLKRYFLAGVAVIALAAGMADAANAAPPAPIAMPIDNWTGYYIGIHGGYGWARDPFTDDIFDGKAAPITDGINSNGWLGGFQAGANWQSGSWVGGLEIDFSATGIKGSTPTGSAVTPFATEIASEAGKLDWLGSARARLGYLAWPNVLLYGTAGPAWTRVVGSQAQTDLLGGGTLIDATLFTTPSWRFGAVVGAGAEVRLWDTNWLARLEYLHYDLGKSDDSVYSDDTGNTLTGRQTAEVVRAGLSYQFGQDAGSAGSAGSASYASAAAMPRKAPLAALWSWSGFYIGAHAGYGWAHDPFTDPDEGFAGKITITDINSSGFVGGLQAGYNRQMGSWIGGLELDLSWSGIAGSTSGTAPITVRATGSDTVTETDSFELLASARARLGYLVSPDVLLYGTGGAAFTRLDDKGFNETATFTSGGTSFTGFTTDVDFRLGWVAGIGAETRLWSSNWLTRLEYLHYDFGDSGSSSSSSGPGFSSGHMTTDVLRAGLSYKFDWNGATEPPTRVAMPVKAVPLKAPMMAWSWSGLYVGGHLGYGWGRDPQSYALSLTGTPPGNIDVDPLLLSGINSSGLVAGFQAGINWQTSAVVSGLEIDLSGTGIKGSTTNLSALGDEAELRRDQFDLLGSARARLGYLVLPNARLYGTGGLAWTRIDQPVSDLRFGGGVNNYGFPDWQAGWVAGVGGETRLVDTNWLLRLEYLHYDFGEAGGFNENAVAAPPFGNGTGFASRSNGHLSADVLRTGLSFKFN